MMPALSAKQRGYTLIEVAIALGLALIAAAVVVQLYARTQTSRKNVEAASLITETQQIIRQRYFGREYAFTTAEAFAMLPDKVKTPSSNVVGFLPNGSRIEVIASTDPSTFFISLTQISQRDCQQLVPLIAPQFVGAQRTSPTNHTMPAAEGRSPTVAEVTTLCDANGMSTLFTSL